MLNKMKYKGLRRMLAFGLILAMVISGINLNALSLYASPSETTFQVGSGVKGVLDSHGVLRLYGSGDTYDYGVDINNRTPFYEFKDSIKKVEISSGITAIGENLFYNCEKLQGSLALPETIVRVGKGAFSGDSFAQAPKFNYVFNRFVPMEVVIRDEFQESNTVNEFQESNTVDNIFKVGEQPVSPAKDKEGLDGDQPVSQSENQEILEENLPDLQLYNQDTSSNEDNSSRDNSETSPNKSEDTYKNNSDSLDAENIKISYTQVKALNEGSLEGLQGDSINLLESDTKEADRETNFKAEGSGVEEPGAEGIVEEKSEVKGNESTAPKVQWINSQDFGVNVFFPGQIGVFSSKSEENTGFILAMEEAGYLEILGYNLVIFRSDLGEENSIQVPLSEKGLFLPGLEESGISSRADALNRSEFIGWSQVNKVGNLVEAAETEGLNEEESFTEVGNLEIEGESSVIQEGEVFSPYSFYTGETRDFLANFILRARDLLDTTIETQTSLGHLVKISGRLPEEAVVSAIPVEEETVLNLLEGQVKGVDTVYFAYDITIKLGEEEYQPSDFGESVKVSISNVSLPNPI